MGELAPSLELASKGAVSSLKGIDISAPSPGFVRVSFDEFLEACQVGLDLPVISTERGADFSR